MSSEGATREQSADAAPEARAEDDGRPAEPSVQVIERHTSPGALARELIPEIAILLVAIALFVIAGGFEYQKREGQLGPQFWPRMAAVGLAIAVLARIVQTIRDRNRPIVRVEGEFDEYEETAGEIYWGSFALVIGLVVGYVVATMFLGYMFATALFLFLFIWLGGERKWYVPLVAAGGGLGLAYVFVGVVYVSLPTGVGIFDTITVEIYKLLGIQ